MPADERYVRQMGLLVRALPLVAKEKCFALKGGTAINLFVRNLPRLSVDIDLAYLPIDDRRSSLNGIEAALRRIGGRIQAAIPSARVNDVTLRTEGTVNRLFVRDRSVQVKIEVTPVLRGCVYQPEVRAVSAVVEERFGFAAMQVVSFPDFVRGQACRASGPPASARPVRHRRAVVERRYRRTIANGVRGLPDQPWAAHCGTSGAGQTGTGRRVRARFRGHGGNAGHSR